MNSECARRKHLVTDEKRRKDESDINNTNTQKQQS